MLLRILEKYIQMSTEIQIPEFLISPVTGESPQREAFNCTKRNQCFSGGYGSGKTWLYCWKILLLALMFPKSRWFLARTNYTDLMRSTVATFKNICPSGLYDPKKGGKLTNEGCTLINGSVILFLHLNPESEGLVRGLEINGGFVDQAEDLDENIYIHLDSRIGRWSSGEVPEYMVTPDWPRNPKTGKPRVPGYLLLAVNPDSELHYIYRRYHEESIEYQTKYSKNHEMITASTLDNPTIDPAIIEGMLERDQVFIDRFVHGKWGIAESAIHRILRESLLDVGDIVEGQVVTQEWITNLLQKARLYRVMDHGDFSPTCCLWVASFMGKFFIYREYYQGDRLVSFHRKAIEELSKNEYYSGNYADPAIFNKTMQKGGRKFSVADEYLDNTLITDSKPIAWTPAQNDEFGIRNRLNEVLRNDPSNEHPITKEKGSPRLYFIKKSVNYTEGCYESILQTKAQKREILGSENGKPIYSDDRDDNITDHAYDPVRYFIGLHFYHKQKLNNSAPPGTFFAAKKELRKQRIAGVRF